MKRLLIAVLPFRRCGADPRPSDLENNVMDIHTLKGWAQAKAWTQNLIDGINDGGLWIVPRSGTAIIFDKKHKRVLVTHQMVPDISIEMVLEALGWEITYKK